MIGTSQVIERMEKGFKPLDVKDLRNAMEAAGVKNPHVSMRLAVTAALTHGPATATSLRDRMKLFGRGSETHYWEQLSRGGWNARLFKRCLRKEIAGLLVRRAYVYVGGWLLRDLDGRFRLHDRTDRLVAADFYEDAGGDAEVAKLLREARKIAYGW